MIEHLKPIELLTAADFRSHPVWEFTNRDGAGEAFVRALKRLPAKNLTGKVVGTQVRLAVEPFASAGSGRERGANARHGPTVYPVTISKSGCYGCYLSMTSTEFWFVPQAG